MNSVDTLLDMAKKKPTQPVEPEPPPEDPHKGIQINLRVIDPELLAAVDAAAKSDRRSRNLMINILLEEALRARKMLPLPAPKLSDN